MITYTTLNEPDEVYRSNPGITQSTLKRYHKVTPEEGRYAELEPRKNTEAMLLGAYVGDSLAFGCCSRIKPFDPSIGVAKNIEAGNSRDLVLGDMLVHLARTKLPASALIQDADYKEVSIYWDEEGYPCKGRCDLLQLGPGILTDIKTTREDLDDRSLRRVIADYGYYMQLAWYKRGLVKAGHSIDHCILLFLKTTEPIQVRAIRLEDIDIQAGEKTILELLTIYRLCEEKQYWPGHGEDVQSLLLPDYIR